MSPIFLPENFTGSDHIQQWADKAPLAQAFEPELLEYFVHLIVRKLSFTDKYYEERQGYVPLYSRDLKRVSEHYSIYLKYLETTDVIEINKSYSTITGRTKAYRLKRQYQYKKVVAKALTNSQVKRTHRKLSYREAQRMQKARLQYSYLTKWLDGLEIDRAAAMAYIDQLEETCKLMYGQDEWQRLHWRFNVMRVRVERIVYKDHSYLVDDSGNRFHSNLTSLNKELRNFLTYKGKHLGGIDIKNSQPYLSQLLLSPGFWAGRWIDNRTPTQKHRQRKLLKMDKDSPETQYLLAEGKLGWNDVVQVVTQDPEVPIPTNKDTRDTLTTQTHTLQHSRLQAINMFLNTAQVAGKHDVTLFLNKIHEGLYEYLMTEIPLQLVADQQVATLYKHLGSPVIDRPFVKQLTMVALYSHPKSRIVHSSFARHVFRHHFPTMHNLFALIKGDDYTILPVLLQRIEAKLVLDRICREFVRRYRQPVFTIHDGLITTQDYITELKAIAEKVLKTAIGAPPKLEPEVWSPVDVHKYIPAVIDRMLKKKEETPKSKYQRKSKSRAQEKLLPVYSKAS